MADSNEKRDKPPIMSPEEALRVQAAIRHELSLQNGNHGAAMGGTDGFGLHTAAEMSDIREEMDWKERHPRRKDREPEQGGGGPRL